jgi:hypothetical protein
VFFIDKMPNEQTKNVQTGGTSTLTLLLVAIAGGIIAVSLQPLILLLYSHLGIPTTPMYYQQSPSKITVEQVPTTTVATIVTTQKIETTTTRPIKSTTTVVTTQKMGTTTTPPIESTTVKNDPTIDEEPIFLKDEPLTIKFPESTTVKPVVNEKTKQSKADNTKKVDKSEEKSQPVKFNKAPQQPEIIDITGRNKQIPDEVKNFKSTRISMFIHIETLK